MTSPYLEEQARKLRLVHPEKPVAGAHRAGSSADHRPRDWRFHRTQREAGIEHHEWEGRIKPVRPVWFFVISAACWAILALAIATAWRA